MVFLKIQFFNKISVPYWEFGCLRKHIFPKGSLLRAMHSLPRTPDPVSCEPKQAYRHRAASVVIQDTAGIPAERKHTERASSYVCRAEPAWALPKAKCVMGSCDCYFAWAEMRKNTFSLGVFCSGLGFFSACSCQLRCRNILGAVGRHTAKNSSLRLLQGASGHTTQSKAWAPILEHTWGGAQAAKALHSCLLRTVYPSDTWEKDNSSCSTPRPWRNSGFPPWPAQLTIAIVVRVGVRSAGRKGLNLSPSSSLSTFIINE